MQLWGLLSKPAVLEDSDASVRKHVTLLLWLFGLVHVFDPVAHHEALPAV